MRNKLMVLGAAALMVAAALVVVGVNVSPVSAQVELAGACGPIGEGWSCSCTTTVVPNVVCLQPGGGEGHLLVTTCRSCPPPCRTFPCHIQKCIVHTSYRCG